jgi:hypothetical protein
VVAGAAVTPLQPVAGVTEKVTLRFLFVAVLDVRVAEELVKATVNPPGAVEGYPTTIVALPVRAVTGVTVMVPAVATPVSSLHETETAVADRRLAACIMPAQLVNATRAKSAFVP